MALRVSRIALLIGILIETGKSATRILRACARKNKNTGSGLVDGVTRLVVGLPDTDFDGVLDEGKHVVEPRNIPEGLEGFMTCAGRAVPCDGGWLGFNVR